MNNEDSAQDPHYSGHAGRQWHLTLVLTCIATMAVIDRTVLSLLFDPVKDDLRLSDTQMSLVFGLAFAVANVGCTLPAGMLADRFSRRGLIALGAVLWSLMTMACACTRSFVPLLVARSGVGSAEAIIHPGSYSLLRQTLDARRRGSGFAVYAMSIMGGSALGFLLGGLLIAAARGSGITHLPLIGAIKPWRLTMLWLGLAGLPVALLLLSVREPLRHGVVRHAGTLRQALGHVGRGWKLYLPVLLYSATMSMQGSAYGAFVASVPLRRFHLSVGMVGLRLGVIMLLVAPLGNALLGLLLDRFGRRRGLQGIGLVGVLAALITVVFSTLTPLAPSGTAYFALAAVMFMAAGGGFAVTGAAIAALTPKTMMGKVSALQLFVYGAVGMGSGPAIVGLVAARMAQAGAAVPIAPALALCSFCFTLVSLLSMLVLSGIAPRNPGT